MSEDKYFIGINMSTTSVGYAVTDPDYNLLRAKGKDMWGIRLFDQANSAEERRFARNTRRIKQRKKERIKVLRSYFEPAINEIDPMFFKRMEESKYWLEDKSDDNKIPFTLFNDQSARELGMKYPTIFHLRKEMLESEETFDVRLVYLAILNLYKRRGHFYNKALSDDGTDEGIEQAYIKAVETAEEFQIALPRKIDFAELEKLLADQDITRKECQQKLSLLTGIDKKQKKEYLLISMLCGLKGKMSILFSEYELSDELKALSIGFRDNSFENGILVVEQELGEEAARLLEELKSIHDKGFLASIMKGCEYLSQARVESYEQHAKDLSELKELLHKYKDVVYEAEMMAYREASKKNKKTVKPKRDLYKSMFRVLQDGNYSAYVGSVNSAYEKKRRAAKGSREEFVRFLKKTLERIPGHETNEEIQSILLRAAEGSFLAKQLSDENSVIPNQVHAAELKAILKKAERYLPFLSEADESGLTVSRRIYEIYRFTLPYYVGPLGQEYKDVAGYNVWAERKEEGKVFPWNFAQKIDLERTEEKFIERLIGKCTYLPSCRVIPDKSFLYEDYKLLNELNNIRVNGAKLPVELKQGIYRDLCFSGKKVSRAAITRYLLQKGHIRGYDKEAVGGISETGLNNALTTYGKFSAVLGEDRIKEYREVLEDVVYYGTIHKDDGGALKAYISERYADLFDKAEIEKMSRFKFDGWSRLSREFLLTEGACKDDGVIRTLMQALWETNDNMQELMSYRYTYQQAVREQNHVKPKPISEWCIDDLADLYLSAPVKRMAWQTIQLVGEIKQIMGHEPERIFVKISDTDSNLYQRKKSRKASLLAVYKKNFGNKSEWVKKLESMDESEFRSRKVYLYFQQMGKCMYTGNPIDFEKLDTGDYTIEHIYPKHFVKDESIENNLILVEKQVNEEKRDAYPVSAEIREDRLETWAALKGMGLISQVKYQRLVRSTPFEEEELAEFIDRMKEDRSICKKAVGEILKRSMPGVKDVVFTRSSNIADFCDKFNISSTHAFNNMFIAKEAYLSILVGNAYHVKFTKNAINFIREAKSNKKLKYHMNRIFDFDIVRNGEIAWEAEDKDNQIAGTISTVRRALSKNFVNTSRHVTENHGAVTRKTTIWGKDKAKKQGYYPIKTSDERLLDVEKYGGRSDIASAGYSLVEYKLNGKEIRSLESVPVYLGKGKRIQELEIDVLTEYFRNAISEERAPKTVSDIKIVKKFIPLRTLIKYDGYFYYLGGRSGNRLQLFNAVELCLTNEQARYIKKMSKAVADNYYLEKDKDKNLVLTKDKNIELYDELIRKFEETVYRQRIGNLKTLMLQLRENFCATTLEAQVKTLLGIIGNIKTGNAADLSAIGGSSNSSILRVSKELSGHDVEIVFRSISGLYERTEKVS